MSGSPGFVHLHLHSEYSLVDGLIRVKPLVKAVAGGGMAAVAITDMGNLFAMIKFYKAALAAGIKPIMGAEVRVRRGGDEPHRLVLLCQNLEGYRNLTRLVSRGYTEGQQRGVPVLERDWLDGATAGLIALSAGREGEVGRCLANGNLRQARVFLDDWLTLFPDRFYLELIRTGRPGEEEHIHNAVELALDTGTPVVASNDVRFLAREDFEAHEARVCIHEGFTLTDPRRQRRYSQQQYLRSAAEMADLFADLPEALENSVEIARRCNLELALGQNFLPDFPIPQGMTPGEYLEQRARQGLEERLERLLDRNAPDFAQKRRPYDERLAIEVGVINQMGFPGYFLIVADFIQWAKDNAIPVGPGRGSGAGSLVAYALKITDLDPLAYDLLFERFLNPERVSMPDFDVDFCMENRDRVIDYVARKYGREKVSQIATHGSMAAKAVVRDVGRVLGHPYGFVDKIAKLIPFEIGMTLEKALEQEEDLRKRYQEDEEVHALIDLARKLEGLARSVGKHAGGVVIAPSSLTEFSPLYCEEGSEAVVTQFDKDDVEAVGLVKFDFLGLRTLTIIDWALETINRQRRDKGQDPLDIADIPLEDKASFDLLKACQTTAVFQLESRGMKDLIKRLQPDRFEDIVALVALFRPGPLQSGMVDDFINRKHGRAKVEYPHPDLEPVLEPTYGIILYQEQVMQIAQVLASYTLGGADLLRRAIGKKKAEEMAKQRQIFIEGASKNGIDEGLSTYMFDLIDKFAGYGFNKTVDRNTRIYTRGGIKKIEDCRAGDRVLTVTAKGGVCESTVVALHDHGQVPLWEVTFDDGTVERCTLDHKWLTRHGQRPLWQILQLDEQVWGTHPYQTGYPRSSEAVSQVFEHDPFRADIRQAEDHVLRCGSPYPEKGIGAFPGVCRLSEDSPGNPGPDLQESGTHSGHAPALFRNSEKNGGPGGYPVATGATAQAVAGHSSGCLSGHPGQGSWFAQAFEDGSLAGASAGRTGLYPQCAVTGRRAAQTGGFRQSCRQDRHRGGRTLAFSTYTRLGVSGQGTATGPNARPGDRQTYLAVDPHLHGAFQRQHRQAVSGHLEAGPGTDSGPQLVRGLVPRKPLRVRFLGWRQGYDLEVDHPEHNFLLASGLCCSNSHSAAYALVSYQTAWLKAHHPAAFMAAVLSSDMDKTDKVVVFIEECRSMGLEVVPPSVNASDYRFTVDKGGQIIYGLGAIKGVGEGAIEGVLEERRAHGPFADLFDFCRRADLRKLNRRVLEALIRAGALDCLTVEGDTPQGAFQNRASLMAWLPEALHLADQHSRDRDAGQNDLFGLAGGGEETAVVAPPPAPRTKAPPWEEDERLAGEKATLGLYLTGHPIEKYLPELKHFTAGRLAAVLESAEAASPGGGGSGGGWRRDRERTVVVAGLVVAVRTKTSNRGGRMAFLTLDDQSARVELRVFNEAFEQARELLTVDQVLVVEGSLAYDDFSGGMRMTAERIMDMHQARQSFARALRLSLDQQLAGNGFAGQLAQLLTPYREEGRCRVLIDYRNDQARAELLLGESWRVRPDPQLLEQLQALAGPVQLLYR